MRYFSVGLFIAVSGLSFPDIEYFVVVTAVWYFMPFLFRYETTKS